MQNRRDPIVTTGPWRLSQGERRKVSQRRRHPEVQPTSNWERKCSQLCVLHCGVINANEFATSPPLVSGGRMGGRTRTCIPPVLETGRLTIGSPTCKRPPRERLPGRPLKERMSLSRSDSGDDATATPLERAVPRLRFGGQPDHLASSLPGLFSTSIYMKGHIAPTRQRLFPYPRDLRVCRSLACVVGSPGPLAPVRPSEVALGSKPPRSPLVGKLSVRTPRPPPRSAEASRVGRSPASLSGTSHAVISFVRHHTYL